MLRHDLFSGMFNHLLLGHVYSPHLCVGFLFLILYPTASSASASSSSASSVSHTNVHTPTLSHTNFHTPSFTHHLCHTSTLSHTPPFTHFHTPSFTHPLSHTIFHTPFFTHKLCHTPTFPHQLCHTPTLSHTNFVTHQLCYTNFVTHQLCQTPSFTHHLCHTPTFTHCVAGVALAHFHFGTWRHPPSCRVAGVALGHTHLRFCVAGVVARLVTGDAAQLCVAGVALGNIHLRFAWQVCGTWSHLPSFRVAGMDWAGSGGALGRAGARLVANDAAQLCVAVVALGDIHLRFAWLWHLSTSTCVLRGRRGTWSLPLWPWRRPSFRVAGAGCPPLVVTKLRDIR